MLKNSNYQGSVVNTASLPDIVFIILFFFMTVTVVKDDSLMLQTQLPSASETKELENKNPTVEIFIGPPNTMYSSVHGSAPKIQIDDRLIELDLVGARVIEKRNKFPEALRSRMTVAIKMDKNATMGVLEDLKQELRKINAVKISYITLEEDFAP